MVIGGSLPARPYTASTATKPRLSAVAMAKARPVLLEPVMKVTVFVPDHYMGDVTGDLNHRRGRIMGVEPADGLQSIIAQVPQAEVFKYASELRSMTGGRGSIWGTIVGAIILGIINNMLNMLGVSPYLQGTVKGIVIIAAVNTVISIFYYLNLVRVSYSREAEAPQPIILAFHEKVLCYLFNDFILAV